MAAMGDSLNEQALVSLAEVEAAAARIASTAVRTPLLHAQSPELPDLWLKCENLQVTGSFKIRGATNAVAQLSGEERTAGVVAHSSGNHAQALARAARTIGTSATIVMPHDSAVVKQRATRALGAEVVLVDVTERVERTEQIHRDTGAALVPPFDDRRVIAGQGTIGLEILDQLPSVGVVLVPVSGGGLIAGVATALKARAPGVRVIGVEPALAGDLAEGLASGTHVAWEVADTNRTIADGLRVPAVGRLPWQHISVLVDDVVTVTEDEIRAAVRDLALREHLVVEPSGAVTYAAARNGTYGRADRPAVAVLSGGNVDPAMFAELVGSPPPVPAGGEGVERMEGTGR
jgi:threonine dehydratase